MSRYEDRWPKQRWLLALEDLRPQGEPETQVFTGTAILLALHVRGLDQPELLAIRWENGPMSAAIADGGITLADGEANFHVDDGDGC